MSSSLHQKLRLRLFVWMKKLTKLLKLYEKADILAEKVTEKLLLRVSRKFLVSAIRT